VHRIGQTRPVLAAAYFARGTVEERMLAWRLRNEQATQPTAQLQPDQQRGGGDSLEAP
jgi:hypothetical protein